MSIEFILGIIVFALLPLIERLIRAAREREEGGTRPAPPPWAPAPDDEDDEAYEVEPPRAPIPPMPAPMPAPRVERRPGASVRPTQLKTAPVKSVPPSRVPSRVTAHDRRTDDAFKAGRARRARADIAAMLHSESGLRRAVVLMTILGPCRAFSPYDGPDR